jgi:thiosulfate dehydrogenase [quinone] large subunit
VVLPNAQLFATLVTWGELLAGVSLILGLMTRLSATVALLLTLNYMLAKGAWPWTSSSNDAAFAAISLALLIGAAGRTFGLDSILAKRWPRSALW